MRIVFRAHPEPGHVHPLMPLAEAARAAGHDVIFPTSGPYLERLAVLGYRTVEVGTNLADARERRFRGRTVPLVVDGETAWESIGELFAEAAVPAAKRLRDVLPEVGADLVIYDNTDLGAAAAAAAADVPAIGVAITRSFEPHVRAQFDAVPLAELQSKFGGVPRSDDPLIDSYLPSAQRREHLSDPRRVPMRAIPWSDPTWPLPRWVRSPERMLVFVTLGSVTDNGDRLRQIVDGLADLDADIIVATGITDVAALRGVPRNVYVEGFVRQADLLPHVDVIVHHGGCGTTTAAWANAVPQLVLPDGADRFVNADAVVATGTGIALDTTYPDLVAKAARALLDEPGYARAAGTARDEIMAMPHPTQVFAALTER